MPSVIVNGTSIYYELRGTGGPLLFIHGVLGDASQFDEVGGLLADEFTVITYDRRGNSRSPRPDGWKSTSPGEQADDAAELLAALSLAPADVFGNSSGAIMALDLVIRHPDAVRRVILHEPPLIAMLREPAAMTDEIGAVIRQGIAAGGPPGMAESFMRWAVGDANWHRMAPAERERIRGNAETSGMESAFPTYRPDDATLAAVAVPVHVMVSDEGMPFSREMAAWLAERLGVQVVRTPGTHAPQLDHPADLAANIRSLLSSTTNRVR